MFFGIRFGKKGLIRQMREVMLETHRDFSSMIEQYLMQLTVGQTVITLPKHMSRISYLLQEVSKESSNLRKNFFIAVRELLEKTIFSGEALDTSLWPLVDALLLIMFASGQELSKWLLPIWRKAESEPAATELKEVICKSLYRIGKEDVVGFLQGQVIPLKPAQIGQ